VVRIDAWLASDGRAFDGLSRNPSLSRPTAAMARNASLREISAALASKGFITPRGLPYSASAVASMLGH